MRSESQKKQVGESPEEAVGVARAEGEAGGSMRRKKRLPRTMAITKQIASPLMRRSKAMSW